MLQIVQMRGPLDVPAGPMRTAYAARQHYYVDEPLRLTRHHVFGDGGTRISILSPLFVRCEDRHPATG